MLLFNGYSNPKEILVIKLRKEGKSYRQIAEIARISPRDIKSILVKYRVNDIPEYTDNDGKVVVITRAANGIGKSIAIELARAGYVLMTNDIVEGELKQTVRDILSSFSQKIIPKYMNNNNNDINQNSRISYFAGDISKEEVSISFMEETIKKFGTIDVLINNATISQQSIASQSYEMSVAAAATTNTNTKESTNYQAESQSSPYFTVEEYGIADTNLKGIYFCIRELVKQLLIYKNLDSDGTIKKSNNNIKKKVDCSIINIASCYNTIPSSQSDAYTLSQSGVDPFTSSRSNIKSLTESIAL
jgi:NAD(P)-dependent dehydrogenase (short-subunit alcohol dehydrogenase family)